MKENISVIFQNLSGKITGFSGDSDRTMIDGAVAAGDRVFMDCDEDAFIIQREGDPVDLSELQINDLPADGLVPVIAMEPGGQIMMFAFANREALRLTIQNRYSYYYSRSRDKLWKKGEDSGHVQEITDVLYSPRLKFCVYVIRQKVAACHTGYLSCFYRRLQKDGGTSVVFNEKKFNPDSVYKG